MTINSDKIIELEKRIESLENTITFMDCTIRLIQSTLINFLRITNETDLKTKHQNYLLKQNNG